MVDFSSITQLIFGELFVIVVLTAFMIFSYIRGLKDSDEN